MLENIVVVLSKTSCCYGEWEITGLSYKHAMVCIGYKREFEEII